MAYQLALIDLDGTLTDSAPGIIASIRDAYAALDIVCPTPETLALFVGPPIAESAMRNGVPPERVQEFIAAYRESYAADGMFNNSVFPGIVDALTALRDAGVRLCVATSKPEVFAVPIMERFGLDTYFDGICGALADGVRSTKGEVVAYALELIDSANGLPAPESIVMVGDREHDILGAREHGVPTISVGWGYAAPGEIAEAGPIRVVNTAEELVDAILA